MQKMKPRINCEVLNRFGNFAVLHVYIRTQNAIISFDLENDWFMNMESNLMTEEATSLLRDLCEQYDKATERHRNKVLPVFSDTLHNDYGYCYVKRTAGTQFFCISSIEFDPSVRGQGVLTNFISYINSNRHYYKGIEIESIQNPKLAKSLRNKGWVCHANICEFAKELCPTLYIKF